jgi:type VI secretion system protein ImpJ
MAIGRINPVAWAEGMFLRPQHFQQHDLQGDARLRYHLQALNPFHWGVRDLAFDEEALAENRIVVVRLEAVLRDGTLVRMPGNATIEPRTFTPGAARIDVHLALRSWSVQDANVVDAGDPAARHRIVPVELPDLNRGGPPVEVEVLEPNLRLLLSGEENELGLYEAFRLAVIESTDDSKRPYALSRSFAPPLLAMQASPQLMEELTKITSQVAARVRAAAAMTRTFSVESVPRLFMRYTLARIAPLLRHLGSTGETPPFALYTTLVELAGALGSYRLEEAVELPVYDHADPWACFKPLMDFIAAELDRLAPENFHKLPLAFDAASQAYATRALNMQLVDPRNAVYLAVKGPLEQQALSELVVQHGKASSLKGVAPLVKFAVPGLPIERLPGPPTEIEAMAGYLYFRLDPRAREWAKVRDDMSFALHLGKLQNANVVLYVALAAEAM